MSRILTTLRQRASKLGAYPFAPVDGNCLELLIDGDVCFQRMWTAIDQARDSVWLETYLLELDGVGRKTLTQLSNAAKRGCEVILIYDHLGSDLLSGAHFDRLRKAGGMAYAFNPVWPWRRTGPLFFRDHRKLLIVDQKIAFCGGRNISRRYAGRFLGERPFRDTHARVQGPVVADLVSLFQETLKEIGRAQEIATQALPPVGPVTLEALSANARRNRRALQARLRHIIGNARRYCYITTPYLLPSWRLLRQITRKAEQGAEVHILVPAVSDVRLADLARQYIHHRLLRKGVRLFEYALPLHAKTLIIDDEFALIGSFNMDRFTSAHNLEVGLAVFDESTAKALKRQFMVDLAQSRELTMAQLYKPFWWVRLLRWLSYRLMSLKQLPSSK